LRRLSREERKDILRRRPSGELLAVLDRLSVAA
jgi:hypothetical protein